MIYHIFPTIKLSLYGLCPTAISESISRDIRLFDEDSPSFGDFAVMTVALACWYGDVSCSESCFGYKLHRYEHGMSGMVENKAIACSLGRFCRHMILGIMRCTQMSLGYLSCLYRRLVYLEDKKRCSTGFAVNGEIVMAAPFQNLGYGGNTFVWISKMG